MSSIEVQNFTYHHGDLELAGYMASPSRYPRAAVLIVPTIAGPNFRSCLTGPSGSPLLAIPRWCVTSMVKAKLLMRDEARRRLADELRSDLQQLPRTVSL